jgi:hypothetical protein
MVKPSVKYTLQAVPIKILTIDKGNQFTVAEAPQFALILVPSSPETPGERSQASFHSRCSYASQASTCAADQGNGEDGQQQQQPADDSAADTFEEEEGIGVEFVFER